MLVFLWQIEIEENYFKDVVHQFKQKIILINLFNTRILLLMLYNYKDISYRI